MPTINLPRVQTEITQASKHKPASSFSFYNVELAPYARCKVTLHVAQTSTQCYPDQLFQPDPLLCRTHGLNILPGLVDPTNPTVSISNETVHPISIAIKMRLGSVSPDVRVTDDFYTIPRVPIDVGSVSSDDSFTTASSIPLCEPAISPVSMFPSGKERK